MATIKEIFNEIIKNPRKHIGFVWLVRMSYHGITQLEVAKEAGVDVKTVNRIINNKHNAEEKTIKRVEAAIDKLAEKVVV